jgi:lysophospholipase L1-like esterase
MESKNRRNFLKVGGASFAAIVSAPLLANTSKEKNKSNIPENLTVLLQGDSITDAGRDKARYYANDAGGMGRGYVHQIVSDLLGSQPGEKMRFYNRGISGHKVFQLANRWDDDCLQLKPDVLSILIGVNDFWHSLNSYKGTVEVYEADFRKLLERTLTALPKVKLIIGEPFAVKGGTAINNRWFPDFPEYQVAAAKIAKEFNAQFIPYQKIFDDALNIAPVSYWCPDGVHPSMAGGYLMKEAWVQAFNKLY